MLCKTAALKAAQSNCLPHQVYKRVMAFSPVLQGAMSELFIARVFEEHVAPQRGAAWPPQPALPALAAAAEHPSSPKLGSLPSIHHRAAGSSPPPYSSSYSSGSNTTNRPISPSLPPSAAATGTSSGGGNSSSGVVRAWPPPLPPGAAGPRDEMDLLAFADFVLAWDHRNHPAAVPYFFKIFDIQHRVSVNPKEMLSSVCQSIVSME